MLGLKVFSIFVILHPFWGVTWPLLEIWPQREWYSYSPSRSTPKTTHECWIWTIIILVIWHLFGVSRDPYLKSDRRKCDILVQRQKLLHNAGFQCFSLYFQFNTFLGCHMTPSWYLIPESAIFVLSVKKYPSTLGFNDFYDICNLTPFWGVKWPQLNIYVPVTSIWKTKTI